MPISEHELMTFQRVKDLLGYVEGGMTVKSTGPLAEALGQLRCFPYVEIPCKSFNLKCKLSIAGKPAGTFEKPDTDLILQESTASPFGRGETTVLDPTYRSGREISAQNMDIAYTYFSNTAREGISASMFLGKTVEVKFYKLAVYEEGGHFDWHMDSTHSDQHHATLLLALNTSWEGGDLKLRRNGVETLVDMHPKAKQNGSGIDLQAVAFYTDTEHKVEPVTKGIRIVLQYDVEVVGWGSALAVNEKDDDEDEEQNEDELFYYMGDISRKRGPYQESSGSLTVDNAVVTKVINIITNELIDGRKEVGLAMQHLYRKSSILPEFLKGADAQLYHALLSSFVVTLQPVVLHSCTDIDGRSAPYLAITWDDDDSSESDLESNKSVEPDAGSNTGSRDDDDSDSETESQPVVFHLPLLSAIEQISYREYIEHTGNEAQPGETKYFGGGMFVRKKKVAKGR